MNKAFAEAEKAEPLLFFVTLAIRVTLLCSETPQAIHEAIEHGVQELVQLPRAKDAIVHLPNVALSEHFDHLFISFSDIQTSPEPASTRA